MFRINESHIDFILDDLRANGVELEDLRVDLLDHICCIVESEMDENEDFYSFYASIIPRFYKNSLVEIQQETEVLLKFKNYYIMKNTLSFSGLITVVLIILGAIFKVMHWPGAAIMIVLGSLMFSLFFLPLLIILKFKDEEKQVDKFVFTIGLLLGIGANIGFLFKLMHWLFANFLMIWSVALLIFLYVPLYFFTRFRRPELRFNTIVNSVLMMASGGLLFALFKLH